MRYHRLPYVLVGFRATPHLSKIVFLHPISSINTSSTGPPHAGPPERVRGSALEACAGALRPAVPDVREEPVFVHSPQEADVFLQCLTTLIMGGNGLSRPGGKLGFRA